MRNRGRQQGITLVEIAFAILIFSIIVTAAVFGLRAVDNAKVKAFIMQMTHAKAGAEAFQRQYGSWPGDLNQATTRLNGCTAATGCGNGNSDGIIGDACQMPAYATGDIQYPAACTNTASETAQFWRHLELADFIDGLKLRAGRYQWGETLPRVRLSGGMQVIYGGDVNNDNNAGMTGHFFNLQRTPQLFRRNVGSVGDSVLVLELARQVDLQLDDGLPNTGNVRGFGLSGCGGPGEANFYNADSGNQNRQCSILYRFDGEY